MDFVESNLGINYSIIAWSRKRESNPYRLLGGQEYLPLYYCDLLVFASGLEPLTSSVSEKHSTG